MRAFALTILLVGISTAVLVWTCFRLIRDAEKMQRDPKLLRRRFHRLGFLYVAGCLVGIVRVATGDLPPIALIGLPISAAIAWTLIAQASKVKVPPSDFGDGRF